jgi:clan AA aspartic protease
MGTFFVTVRVGDPEGQQFEQVESLVDTGATYTSVPASLLRRLGVEATDSLDFIQADGARYKRDIGQTWIEVEGKRVITIVIFGEEDSPPLLGAYTLEGVRLAPDPVNRRLVPVPGYLVTRWPVPGKDE